MAIDGYIIYTDTTDIQKFNKELQRIGRNINQIAKRVNSTSSIYKADIEELSKMPVCYNGDVTTVAQLQALETEFPALSGIMVGRGIIADPALFRKALGGPAATREELRGYLDDLYHGYTALFGSAGCAISRMKGHWFYLIHCFEGAEKLEKQLKKLREPWEYETVVNQIFTLPLH